MNSLPDEMDDEEIKWIFDYRWLENNISAQKNKHSLVCELRNK